MDLLISELALCNNLMGQLHHLVREGHSRRRVFTVAAGMLVKTWIVRVISTDPVVVAIPSALVVNVITSLQSHCLVRLSVQSI